MRGIYENSTDIEYSCVPREELIELGNALGFLYLRDVTTATLVPQRTFYHCALNGIQTRIKILETGELDRGKHIADITDTIYVSKIDRFNQAVKEERLEPADRKISEKYQMVKDFVNQIADGEKGKIWNEKEFSETWFKPEFTQYRWQTKALETYIIVKNRIENGEYVPASGWSAEKATLEWSNRNLEYKHYRDIGRRLVDEYIAEKYTPDQQLTRYSSEERNCIVVFGAIASGKSFLATKYLNQISPEQSEDIILHDADYLKFAMARSAINEGKLKKYTGKEVQNESSNALFEGTRKRFYRLRTKNKAPNVLLTSIGMNDLEMEEFLFNGGSVIAHHVSTDFEITKQSNEKRALTNNRLVPEEDLKWSIEATTKSVMNSVKYKNRNVKLYLYERNINEVKNFGLIDYKNSQIYITDIDAFLRMPSRLNLNAAVTPETKQNFLKNFIDNGFQLNILNKEQESIASIDTSFSLKISKQKNSEYLQLGIKSSENISVLKSLASSVYVGNIKTSHKPNFQNAIVR